MPDTIAENNRNDFTLTFILYIGRTFNLTQSYLQIQNTKRLPWKFQRFLRLRNPQFILNM